MQTSIEWDDVQSLILRGFGGLQSGVFLKMRVSGDASATQARADLRELNQRIRFGIDPANTPGDVINIAFSAPGLSRLGVDNEIVGAFSQEFLDGMHTRSRILGDDPRDWEWGTGDDVPHAVLFVLAESDEAADKLQHEVDDATPGWRIDALPRPKALLVPEPETKDLECVDPQSKDRQRPAGPSLREHFGFVDGIGNPTIRTLREDRPENEIAAGEILLGYPNETGFLPPSPRVDPGGGRGVVLIKGDFGRNGSYLVMRQLEQNVHAFWSFLLDKAGGDPDRAIFLAAKMVGRWPNGAPLARWSSFEPSGDRRSDDHFLYDRDRDGLGCPLGAHIRRTNPRDASPMLDPQTALINSKRRRLLRRGRAYGEPIRSWPDHPSRHAWPQPERIVKDGADTNRRGIHFLSFCASLSGQFEFVQQNWINSRKFAGLPNDADPLLANASSTGGSGASGFTLQEAPVNKRIDGLANFVTTRGGAYLFMPGRRALHYIAGPVAETDTAVQGWKMA